MRASSCLVTLSVLAAAWATPAVAAEITDIADAADTIIIGETEREDMFDLYVGTQFRMHLGNGKITREPISRGSMTCGSAGAARDCLPVDEARWKRTTNVLDIELQLGIFHDLAALFNFHYILGDTIALRYAKDVSGRNSSIDPQSGDPNDTLFTLGSTYQNGFRAQHSGWGNQDGTGFRSGGMDMGLAWAPLSDERDDSKPTWTLTFLWSNPWLAEAYNPRVRATEAKPGSVGDGVHYLHFGTAMSKRVANFGMIGIDPKVSRRGYLDPYIELKYVLPLPQRERALPELTRTTENFGRRPPHVAQLNAGLEVVAIEDLMHDRKVSVDLGLRSAFFSEGRTYSELTDALGELTYIEQYFNVSGLLGLYIQAAEFLRFQAGLMFGYNGEHFLTFEEVGKDENGDGQVLDPADDPLADKDRLNPYFCGADAADRCSTKGLPSYDQVGFRFKNEEHVVFSWFASLTFSF